MKKSKQIIAIIGILLLIALYLITLIAAIFTTPTAASFFKICIFSAMVVPIILYLFISVFHIFDKKDKSNKKK